MTEWIGVAKRYHGAFGGAKKLRTGGDECRMGVFEGALIELVPPE